MSSTICKQCAITMTKNMKIQQADYEFQIKKIKEDQSTQKALYEIHLQKQVRKYQEKYHQQKQQRQQQNHNWLVKYDNQQSKYEKQIQNMVSNHKLELDAQIQTLKTRYTQEITNLKEQHTASLADLNSKFENQKQQLISNYQDRIEKIQKQNQVNLANIKKVHRQTLEQIKRNHSSQVSFIESQLSKELKLHSSTKEESKSTQQKLYTEIFTYKGTINSLQTTIKQLQATINNLHTEISQQKLRYTCLVDQNAKAQQQIRSEYEHKISMIEDEHAQIIKQNQLQILQACKKYENTIEKMENIRSVEKQLYVANIEDIKGTIENRMSRSQDLIEIELLRQKLTKKTKQCELMLEQLKWYRLQLQNKEETYNKIFVPLVANSGNNNNENVIGKRKQFKLRRQGRSVTTVRDILQSMGSNNLGENNSINNNSKKNHLVSKAKVL